MGAILIPVASGYIGGRLARHLVDADVDIRVAGRDPQQLTDRWPGVKAVELDVMRPETIGPATEGVTTAYYLIHSMEEGGVPFEEREPDRRHELRSCCRQERRRADRLPRGLGRSRPLSEPGQPPRDRPAARRARPPVLELRAGMVIGAGSASFRMLEDLVKRLPVMVTPRWVDTRS